MQIDVPSDLAQPGSVTAVSAGGYYTCAVTTTGITRCWGTGNGEGESGTAPAFTSPPPPAGQVGVAYTQTFTTTAAPSVTPYYIPAGTLPPGLTLNPTTGVLFGYPLLAGTYTVDVSATNQIHADATHTYQVTIT